ncbi:uncharacterized protein METZ01_LOCUS216339 [marine metagenome]|uniref:Uncharacterized protein n=1 Tax=marine metagenome TaxID=408172 RepID=A0A382FLJ0_9ZZZZ
MTVNNYRSRSYLKQVAAMIAAGRSFYDQIQRFKLTEIELSIIIISATILLVIFS